jgi:hypothetical protein
MRRTGTARLALELHPYFLMHPQGILCRIAYVNLCFGTRILLPGIGRSFKVSKFNRNLLLTALPQIFSIKPPA